jgi:enoyl-CoA hydratase/carnithine racemase
MEDEERLVLVSVDRGVAHVVLNRPERQNAWTGALGRRYFAALHALARDGEVRAIVVSGAGGAFSSGADPKVLERVADRSQGVAPERPYWTPLAIGKPLVGAIAGPCFGIGLQQALCLDIRFAAEDAKFSTAYARRGLVAEMGMSWLLPRIVGTGHAADMLFSGRVVRAAEAERIGLANRVTPAADLEAAALEYARGLAAACSPRAMRTMKEQLYRDLMQDFVPAYDRAQALLGEAVQWPDLAEGVACWKEQRPPAFPPLPPELATIEVEAPGEG